ncbi:MAG: SpoIIE family protein phosphatase [Lachnospiraceae bacterium]|nr:SpoIIE family protein phosphatase [Lachnospiraceae bacterium]MBR6696737.1 SpoIIE family protein phosphatase [Lachnospiraceae bacterium]
MKEIDMMYSKDRLSDASRTFRRLAETYNELSLGQENSFAYEYKKTIVEQLLEMAEILNGLSGENSKELYLPGASKRALIKELQVNGVQISNIIFIEREYKRVEIILVAKCAKNTCMTTKEIGAIISTFLGKEYIPAPNSKMVMGRELNEYVFVEAPKFKALQGIARVNKKGNDVSGDSFSFSNLDSGHMVLSLVDGMGCGAMANRESAIVIELLEQFLEAGFSEKTAIGLINSAFSINDYIGKPVTIDMSVVDLYTGMCNCIKLGAASTFIKRNSWVEIIKSTTFPIGVLSQVDFDNSVKKLYDGDYIIMVSDGVLDAIPFEEKELYMMDLISSLNIRKPEGLAKAILDEALSYTNMRAMDDMTVLVAGIFAK